MKVTTHKISTCLWFNGQAEAAARFYAEVFDNAKINNTVPYQAETPSAQKIGSVMTVDFQIEDHHFVGLNGGPMYQLNPSISFFVNFDPSRDKNAAESLEKLWHKMADGGKVLMPLDTYPFSPKYGWVQDKFGISWQLILSNPEGEERPVIVPSLLFCQSNVNKAEEAAQFYTSVFKKAKMGNLFPYPEATGPAKKGSVAFGDFKIENQWMGIMDSGTEQDFTFSEGISFMIHCDDQQEIDYYWEKLSADSNAGQCGWQKDKYGLSWQVIPKNMGELINSKAAMQAMMQMKKIDIEALKNS